MHLLEFKQASLVHILCTFTIPFYFEQLSSFIIVLFMCVLFKIILVFDSKTNSSKCEYQIGLAP